MATTVQLAVVVSVVVPVMVVITEIAIQSYRRRKDNTDDEIESLRQSITEIENEIDQIQENQQQTFQYLLGLSNHEDDDGALGEIQQTLDRLEADMEEEHSQVYQEVRQNNFVLAQVVDQLDDLSHVEKFDADDIDDDKESWRAD
jgi:prefoldin subunit 5